MGSVVRTITRTVKGIFKEPKVPSPDPRIGQAQARQEAILEKQEARALQREKAEARKLSSRRRARRSGGLRLLLSSDRANAMSGIDDDLKNTLGG